ncbi:MAG: YHS domain-containing protein [Nitrososphaerales archaeon]
MATDPVCKMQVDEKNSPSSNYKGKTYHFCCPSCKDAFDKNPAKYK